MEMQRGRPRGAPRALAIIVSLLGLLVRWIGWKAFFLLPALSIVAAILVLAGVLSEETRRTIAPFVRGLFLTWLCLTAVSAVLISLDSYSNENLTFLAVASCGLLVMWIPDRIVSKARPAVWVGGIVALAVLAVSSWQLISARLDLTPFQRSATSVCRDEMHRIRSANDPQAAQDAGARLRERLARLSPPPGQEGVYSQYLKALKGAEDAVAAGNAEQAKFANYYIDRNAAILGIDGSCSTPYD